MSNIAVTSGKTIFNRAVALASKGGDTLNAIFIDVADHKEKAAGAVFLVFDWLITNMKPEELASLPVPGSKTSESNNPDKYSEKVTKDGQTRDVPHSFYADWFDSMKTGKEINETLVGLEKVRNGSVDAPENLKTMKIDDRRVLKDRMGNRRRYGKAMLVQAVQILQQKAAFSELELIEVKLLRDKDNHVRMTPKPIKIFDVNNAEDLEMYSVSTFLSLKPATALLKGGTMEAVKSTIGRGTRTEATGTGIAVKNANDFDAAIAALAGFLKDVGETRGPKRTALLKHLNEAGSDSLLKSMQYTYECLDHYLGLPEIAKRVETLDLSDDSDAPEQEAEAAVA